LPLILNSSIKTVQSSLKRASFGADSTRWATAGGATEGSAAAAATDVAPETKLRASLSLGQTQR
jgi:hypothetical protein